MRIPIVAGAGVLVLVAVVVGALTVQPGRTAYRVEPITVQAPAATGLPGPSPEPPVGNVPEVEDVPGTELDHSAEDPHGYVKPPPAIGHDADDAPDDGGGDDGGDDD